LKLVQWHQQQLKTARMRNALPIGCGPVSAKCLPLRGDGGVGIGPGIAS
jgi:hypothetical protein